MDPIFAIGDIHGQRAALEQALERIDTAPETGQVVFVGDYIDRGPDSRGVISLLMQGQAEDRDWVCLLGNHDTFLPAFLDGPDTVGPADWIGHRWISRDFGGLATLQSYGVDIEPTRPVEDVRADALQAVPRAHLDWLRALPRMHQTDHHIFVHAGIRPGVALHRQDPEDLIWIRQGFLDDDTDHGKLVVHGHTPGDRPGHFGNRVNLDGGAGWGNPLLPVLLLGREAVLLGPDGRVAL